MFCTKCGKDLGEEVKFCSNCGTALEEKKEQFQEEEDSVITKITKIEQTIKKNKKPLVFVLIGVACAALILGVILAFVNKGGYSSPEEAAENFVYAAYTGDAEKLVDCVPEFVLRRMALSYGFSEVDKKEIIKILNSDISDSDRSNCVVLSAVREEGYSSDLSYYIEEIARYGEIYAEIDEYCLVYVNSIVDGDTEEDLVLCTKIDGSWYAMIVD